MSFTNDRLVSGFPEKESLAAGLQEKEAEMRRLQDEVSFARAIASVTHVRDGIALYVDDLSEWRTHVTAAGSDTRALARTAIVDTSEIRTDEWASRLSDRRGSPRVSRHSTRAAALEAAMDWVASGKG